MDCISFFAGHGISSTHPRLLDCLEQLLGPDILLKSTRVFFKHAKTASYVGWHQDGITERLEDGRATGLWLGLTAATVKMAVCELCRDRTASVCFDISRAPTFPLFPTRTRPPRCRGLVRGTWRRVVRQDHERPHRCGFPMRSRDASWRDEHSSPSDSSRFKRQRVNGPTNRVVSQLLCAGALSRSETGRLERAVMAPAVSTRSRLSTACRRQRCRRRRSVLLQRSANTVCP